MSPAVLTETLWALAQEPEPTIPTRVIVVTTADGRREMERQLFGPEPRFGGRTPWEALRDALSAASSLREKLRAAGGHARLLAPCLPEKGRFSLAVPGAQIHLNA